MVLANENVNFHEISAIAAELDGFTVRRDYMSVIKRYLRENTIFWPMLKKEAAESDPVQELLEGPDPTAGFVDKISLNPPENPANLSPHDLTAPMEYIKGIGGVIRFNHYAKSLYQQQGRPYGDIVSRKTDRMMIRIVKILEKALFTGNATTNPLQFNGLDSQMPASQQYAADATTGDSVVRKIRGIVRLAMDDEDVLKNITHIFCTGLGMNIIENEMENRLEYFNQDTIRPGVKVPFINTHAGQIPIITSPYIDDIDGGVNKDVIRFYLLDMNTLSWKGVYPDGGDKVFEPQIFEVAKYTTDATPYLVEKRMALCYGTLFAGNRGFGIHRLDMSVASGTIGSI